MIKIPGHDWVSEIYEALGFVPSNTIKVVIVIESNALVTATATTFVEDKSEVIEIIKQAQWVEDESGA